MTLSFLVECSPVILTLRGESISESIHSLQSSPCHRVIGHCFNYRSPHCKYTALSIVAAQVFPKATMSFHAYTDKTLSYNLPCTRSASFTRSNMTQHMSNHVTSRSRLPSPAHFETLETIELDTFPKYLPLRPGKASWWRQRPVHITVGIILLLVILAGTVIASLFTGKSLQAAQYRKHPDEPMTTMIRLPKVTSNVTVTQTSVVASTMNVTVSSAQITAVTTQVLREAYAWRECSTKDAMCLVMVPQTVV